MVGAIQTSLSQCKLLQGLLKGLSKLENKTLHLTTTAYEWCSVICKNYSTLADSKDLLYLSLEIGFHHLDPQNKVVELVHTQYHQLMAKVIFESSNGEVIADLLYAWTSESLFDKPYPLLSMCAGCIINSHHLQPFSSRLRRLFIRSIELIGYQEFKQFGVEEFAGLLDILHINIEDIDNKVVWIKLLLDVIQCSEGIQHLSYECWKLLVKLVVSLSYIPRVQPYTPHIITFLKDTKWWGKLTCWIVAIGGLWPPEQGQTTEEELELAMVSLFCKQPSAVQEVGQWISQMLGTQPGLSMSYNSRSQFKQFQSAYKRACNNLAQQPMMSTRETKGPAHPQQSNLSQTSMDDSFYYTDNHNLVAGGGSLYAPPDGTVYRPYSPIPSSRDTYDMRTPDLVGGGSYIYELPDGISYIPYTLPGYWYQPVQYSY
jgi:hypothetical protein